MNPNCHAVWCLAFCRQNATAAPDLPSLPGKVSCLSLEKKMFFVIQEQSKELTSIWCLFNRQKKNQLTCMRKFKWITHTHTHTNTHLHHRFSCLASSPLPMDPASEDAGLKAIFDEIKEFSAHSLVVYAKVVNLCLCLHLIACINDLLLIYPICSCLGSLSTRKRRCV